MKPTLKEIALALVIVFVAAGGLQAAGEVRSAAALYVHPAADDVVGTFTIQQQNGADGWGWYADNDNGVLRVNRIGSSAGERFTQAITGELGLGNTSPASAYGGSGSIAQLSTVRTSDGAATTALNLINAGTADNTAVDIDFTPNPNVPLQRIRALRGASSNYSLGFWTYNGSLTEKMRLQGDGSLTIGTTTDQTDLLYVNGATTINGAMVIAGSNNLNFTGTGSNHCVYMQANGGGLYWGICSDNTKGVVLGNSGGSPNSLWCNSAGQCRTFLDFTSGNTGTGAITGGALSVSTITATGAVTITTTSSPQLSVRYDASNNFTAAVSSAGAVTFDANGGSQGFTFNDALTASTVNSTVYGAIGPAKKLLAQINGVVAAGTSYSGDYTTSAWTMTKMIWWAPVTAGTGGTTGIVWKASDGANTCTCTAVCTGTGIKTATCVNGAGTGCAFPAAASITLSIDATSDCATYPSVGNVSAEGTYVP